MTILSVNESAILAYAQEVARTASRLERAGLPDEANALRRFAADRVERARREAAGARRAA